MGYTLDLYKSLLFKELFGENYEQKLKNGNLPPVNEEKMQDAIKKVYKQLDDLGPNLEDTEGAFKEFVEGSENPELYELFGHDKGAAGKYANGRKVEQFKKNREAFMKMAVEPLVRQEIEWVSAAGRLGISEEKRHSFCTHLDRWTKNLMHTDGSPESAKHNDEVAALFALCYKDMTEEEFKNFRRKHYEDLRKNGKLDISDDDIKLKLDEEVKNAPERILNIIKDEVKDAPGDVKKLRKEGEKVMSIYRNLPNSFAGTLDMHMKRLKAYNAHTENYGKMTNVELSSRTGLSEDYIGQLRKDGKGVRYETVCAICIALHLHPIFSEDLMRKAHTDYPDDNEGFFGRYLIQHQYTNSLEECNKLLAEQGYRIWGKATAA